MLLTEVISLIAYIYDYEMWLRDRKNGVWP